MPTLPQRYDRIAPWYDLLDAGFERKRYAALRPLMFEGLGGQLLDAGVGTGRNCAYYPDDAVVSGIDTSAAMLARAEQRCPTLAAGGRLYRMDVTDMRCGRQTERHAAVAGLGADRRRPVHTDPIEMLTLKVA